MRIRKRTKYRIVIGLGVLVLLLAIGYGVFRIVRRHNINQALQPSRFQYLQMEMEQSGMEILDTSNLALQQDADAEDETGDSDDTQEGTNYQVNIHVNKCGDDWTDMETEEETTPIMDFVAMEDIDVRDLKKDGEYYVLSQDKEKTFLSTLYGVQQESRYSSIEVKFAFQGDELTEMIVEYIFDERYVMTDACSFTYEKQKPDKKE